LPDERILEEGEAGVGRRFCPVGEVLLRSLLGNTKPPRYFRGGNFFVRVNDHSGFIQGSWMESFGRISLFPGLPLAVSWFFEGWIQDIKCFSFQTEVLHNFFRMLVLGFSLVGPWFWVQGCLDLGVFNNLDLFGFLRDSLDRIGFLKDSLDLSFLDFQWFGSFRVFSDLDIYGFCRVSDFSWFSSDRVIVVC
jgi:hypothetical protein